MKRNNKRIAQSLLKFITPYGFLHAYKYLSTISKYIAAKVQLDNQAQLHLACGGNIIKGWANIDIDRGSNIIPYDLSRRLPIRTGTIRLIFCEHFIEHLSLVQARKLLRECFRCLESGGIIRLSTPDLQIVLDEYQRGRTSKWHDVGFSPETPCQMINDSMHAWGHQFVFDELELSLLLNQIGFSDIKRVPWHQSENPALCNLECRPYHDEIIIEATKR